MSAGVGNARIVSLYAVNKISGAKMSSMSWSQATVPTTETARMDRIVVLNAVSGIVTSCSQLLSHGMTSNAHTNAPMTIEAIDRRNVLFSIAPIMNGRPL